MQNITNSLIIIAIIAWLLQIVLGWWQVSKFNKEFEKLCKQGNVGIGRTSGRFRPKVVIAIAFDQNHRVVNSIILKGLTVFARPRTITKLQGLLHSEIVPEAIFPSDKQSQQALKQAIQWQ
ncbi:transcriptional regulator GutM [Gallibacterium anatis]|uniref:Transcriptional regulator GutM n=4 Tax=Gallibacterium anatis TaxID=750 RepID=A0A0A2ZTC3_9PAST|nr:transcriptional regulator GutM [Gallibacterium anatis]AEC17566.1 DNA-binding transcriptional activator GutM [Gallibacterium anatis UMN179]ERF79307.1 XRE family transcriptional regulator [Gallibacterium anatis 12656/12]KGQ24154.1 XRE family transcriptional regulator [Gallibacterium anatis]KGQ29388.1 XRE family transcriptional regulator [Gallibacterium anatis]KGQ35842.1 XRE family transcriptional regulator [Gallibacterium anatis]